MPGRRYLIGEKHLIWNQIINLMNQFKPYFEVIQENKILMQHVQIDINKIWKEI